MYLDYTHEQKTLKQQVREYFIELMVPSLMEELAHTESGGPLYTEALRRMGEDGWLGLGWPKRYGGRELGAVEQFIFYDETQRAGFPLPLLTLNTVGPTLMRYGSEAQKEQFLPRIMKGEVHFSIGYTEPHAGTDLAALSCRAVRDGEEYVITGQKTFCSLAHHADYLWLAVRTGEEGSRHKGISLLVVPRDAPGITLSPIQTLGDNRVSAVYLDGVRVGMDQRVGGENEGWKLITSQLNHERVALFPVGFLEHFLEQVTQWAREEKDSRGGCLLDQPWVRWRLGEVHAGLDVLRLFNWRQAWNIERGGLPPQEASAVKVYGSEFYVKANRLLMEVLGEAGVWRHGSPGAFLQGKLERYYRGTLVLTFGGGANEIQRDIIATTGLGLPRPPR